MGHICNARSPRSVVERPYRVPLCGDAAMGGAAAPMPNDRANGESSAEGPEANGTLELKELEEELCRLGGVLAVRVVGDRNGRPVEVHVLSDHSKPAKQTVRDVRAVAQTVFGLEIDHRIVSVAQFDNVDADNPSFPLAPRSERRVRVAKVRFD